MSFHLSFVLVIGWVLDLIGVCGDDFVPRDTFGSIQTLVRLLQLGEGGGYGHDGGVCNSYLAGRSQDSDKHPTVDRTVPLQWRIIWPKLIVLKVRNSSLYTIMYLLAPEVIGFLGVISMMATSRFRAVLKPNWGQNYGKLTASSVVLQIQSPQMVAHAFCSFYICLQQERESSMYLVIWSRSKLFILFACFSDGLHIFSFWISGVHLLFQILIHRLTFLKFPTFLISLLILSVVSIVEEFYFVVIYNAVLISPVQQSDSVFLYIFIYIFFFIFFSILVYCRILNTVPCAISRVLFMKILILM